MSIVGRRWISSGKCGVWIARRIAGERSYGTEGRPTVTGGRPTMTEGRPTVTGGRPTVTEGCPTVTEGRPTVTEGRPTVKGGSLSCVGRRMLLAWVAAASTAVAAVACGQLVGIGNDPPQGPIAPSPEAAAEGGFTYGQGACAACVATNCDAEMTACAGTPSCSGLESCMSGCNGDATCRATCGAQDGLGNDGATPGFEACLASHCETQCGLTCGGLAAVFPAATATACAACISAPDVCKAATTCATSSTCQAALRCQFSAPTIDVWQTCPVLAEDAGAAPIFAAQSAPIVGSCSDQCSWGTDWSCVGNVHWPGATLGPLEIDELVYSNLDQAPIGGAIVKLCNTLDFACGTSITQQTTDDAGNARLLRGTIQTQVGLYLDVSSAAITPVLEFVAFPINQSRLASSSPTVPPGYLTQLDAFGATVDLTLGAIAVAAVDCRLAPAPRVQFSLVEAPPSTQVFYFSGSTVSTTATVTDRSGGALFVNVPVDSWLTLLAKPQALDGGVSGTTQIFARDGGESQVYFPPTP